MYEELTIRSGAAIYYELLAFLPAHGYERVKGDELTGGGLEPGQYQLQGDRLTLFIAEDKAVVNIDFFDRIVERISRAKQNVSKLTVIDNRLLAEDGIIEPGGYLVHPHHGIGLFRGRYSRPFHGERKNFLLLEYAGGDTLFFPRAREAELMPYYGSKTPRLSRLHSVAWQRTKRRIEADLYAIATELLTTQASRELVRRTPWPVNNEWQQTVADSFAHTLTVDQERALAEVMTDLTHTELPMDRLLTGDVGYGKTEVAIRAAVPVMSHGGQVVVVAPTTVLAEQHYHVFSQRLAALPVRVIKLSRSSRLTAAIRQQIINGYYDCIIGTHQVFSQQLAWPKLGLVIIDEEQRFGIKQKEHFKRLRATVDVLSLTATPIPRTLYMGLSGLRGLSSIRTPPGERQGVTTTVTPYNETVVKEAIVTEVERAGQIYYVHNRVATLPAVSQRIQRALGEEYRLVRPAPRREPGTIRFAVAHGRLAVEVLSRVMHQFFNHEIDLLITTSIVEHGLDNPNANTVIVERAEHFGLADLYQLRGRVGRRDQPGYARLLIGDSPSRRGVSPKPLREDALERLKTIADTARLGSGWSIALKDLEIRGAGSLLGSRQHGNLEAIGLVLYSRLLKRIITQLQTMSSSGHLTSAIVDGWSV